MSPELDCIKKFRGQQACRAGRQWRLSANHKALFQYCHCAR